MRKIVSSSFLKVFCYSENFIRVFFIKNKSLLTMLRKWSFPLVISFGKCDQIRRKLRIWLHLLKKSLMDNFTFRAVYIAWKSLYEMLLEELPNNVRLRIVGIEKRSGTSQNWVEHPASNVPFRNKVLAIGIKTHVKADVKVFWSSSILGDYLVPTTQIFGHNSS